MEVIWNGELVAIDKLKPHYMRGLNCHPVSLSISRGWGQAPGPPPLDSPLHMYDMVKIDTTVFEIVRGGEGLLKPSPGACPGIRKRGGSKSKSLFFFAFQFIRGGGPAQKLAEKMTFSTTKVAKYR